MPKTRESKWCEVSLRLAVEDKDFTDPLAHRPSMRYDILDGFDLPRPDGFAILKLLPIRETPVAQAR